MIVNKDTTRIKAKVVMVDMGRRRILLDIGGYGIKGICNLSDWNGGGATTVLNMVDIKEGDVASVSVIGKYDNRKGSVLSNAYRCVRVQANPYAGIERKFPGRDNRPSHGNDLQSAGRIRLHENTGI